MKVAKIDWEGMFDIALDKVKPREYRASSTVLFVAIGIVFSFVNIPVGLCMSKGIFSINENEVEKM